METIVTSSSGLNLFRSCRKAFELGYVRNLDPVGTSSEAVENGTSIHKFLADAASGYTGWQEDPLMDDNAAVAHAYLDHNPLPENILSVEDRSFFVKLAPKFYVRCTFDLVYQDGDTIVVRDYKTFKAKPNLNLDLDFQGRFYIAAAKRHYKKRVDFEYEYIRQTPPGVPHNAKGECWKPEDCYLHYPLVISDREADDVWAEAVETARDIRLALSRNRKGTWYRNTNKSWAGCQSCFYRQLCAAENQLGELDEQTTAALSIPRQPLTLERAQA
jgi:hypothetical protein